MRLNELRTPSYIVQEGALKHNLEILSSVSRETGCKILLAQKAFSMFRVYPMIAEYLDGTTASGICEARLAHEEFRPGHRSDRIESDHTKIPATGVQDKTDACKEFDACKEHDSCKAADACKELDPCKGADAACDKNCENHVFEPAYKTGEMKELCEICTHIYFNSLSQLELHRPVWEPYQKAGKIKVALRINPEFSTQEGHEIYDPCSRGSRLGIRKSLLPERLPEGVTGLHFHTLCEQNVQPLIDTFRHIEKEFAPYLEQAEWINMGGGHHITRDDYDVSALKGFLKETKDKYGFDIYLEPGEAVALNAGTLITTVMDVIDTEDHPTLILDASAACHMPDVLEMPYTPPLLSVKRPVIKEGSSEYDMDVIYDSGASYDEKTGVRLASRTCLAGDVIGVYEMPSVPEPGDVITFGDMAIYSMVKNNTFNGMLLPDIVLEHDTGDDDRFEIVKSFGYEDFKERLS